MIIYIIKKFLVGNKLGVEEFDNLFQGILYIIVSIFEKREVLGYCLDVCFLILIISLILEECVLKE